MPKSKYLLGKVAEKNLSKAQATNTVEVTVMSEVLCNTFFITGDCGPTRKPCSPTALWNRTQEIADGIMKAVPEEFIKEHGKPPYGPYVRRKR